MIGNDSLGLLFRLTAKDDASDEFKKFRRIVDDELKAIDGSGKNTFLSLGQSAGFSAETMGKLSGALPLVGAALAGVSAAAGGAAAGLFALVKNASSYGDSIGDAADKTGLSIATLSALRFQADVSEQSFDALQGAVVKFSRQIVEANQGNEKAIETLKRFGIDPKKAINDLDGALGDVIKKILQLPEAQQGAAAMSAFGKAGAELLPFLHDFNGNLPELIKHAKEVGAVMSEEDVKAAGEFEKNLNTLTAQAKATANLFAMQYMRDITSGLSSVNTALINNKSEVQKWGADVGSTLRGLKNISSELYDFSQTTAGAMLKYLFFGGTLVARNTAQLFDKGAQPQEIIISDSDKNSPFAPPTPKNSGSDSNFLDNEKAAADAKAEREKRAKEQLEAQNKLNAATKESIEIAYDELQRITKENYEKLGGSAEKYRADQIANEQVYTQTLIQLTNNEFDNKLAQEGKNKTARQAIEQERINALERINQLSEERQREVETTIINSEKKQTETVKKETDKRLQITEDATRREIELLKASAELREATLKREKTSGAISEDQYDAATAQLEINTLAAELDLLERLFKTRKDDLALEQEIKLLKNDIAVKGIENDTRALELQNEINAAYEHYLEVLRQIDEQRKEDEENLYKNAQPEGEGNDRTLGGMARDFLGESILTSVDAAGNRFNDFANVLKTVGRIGGDALKGLALGVGNLVQNFVLLGNSGGQSMRKLVASVLASVAMQAATIAVMETAYGLAALTPWGFAIYGAPHLHFQAAALMGSVALGAGLLGRAVAGDSFKKETSGGYGTANAGQTSFSGSSSGGSASSSANQERTITESRRQSQEADRRTTRQVIELRIPRGMMEQAVMDGINDRTELHGTLVKLVTENA